MLSELLACAIAKCACPIIVCDVHSLVQLLNVILYSVPTLMILQTLSRGGESGNETIQTW